MAAPVLSQPINLLGSQLYATVPKTMLLQFPHQKRIRSHIEACGGTFYITLISGIYPMVYKYYRFSTRHLMSSMHIIKKRFL